MEDQAQPSDGKPKEQQEEEDHSSSSSSSTSTGMSIEKLRKYLADKLGFSNDEPQEKIKVLDHVSVDGIIDYIKAKNITKIITMAGAGISTSAGIPDFRSPGSGLYHNLQKYDLPHPQAIFELDFFYKNPKPFFVLAKELYPGSFKPTICHYFIKMLHDKGLLLRHYTQNIDTLERVAGLPAEKIVEAHGTFYKGHCLECKKEYALEWMRERIFKDEIPTCEDKCTGVVKPDIIFFGENLPPKFHRLLNKDFPECELLIILGSSLIVQPFASLVDRVKDECPRLLINREKAGERNGLMTMIGMGGGLDFESKDNTRDVAWLGDCDDGCLLLAEKLGFVEELRKLVEEEHKRIDKQTNEEKKKETPNRKPNSDDKQVNVDTDDATEKMHNKSKV